MVDRYHGPSSLYVLCTHFRLRILATSIATEPGPALQDLLRNMCDVAGATEPFPSYSDQSLVHLLPKQQAIIALDQFFKDVDYTTDIFVQSNFLANLEFIYSQPLRARDEAWAICLKAIVLLVLGKEVSAQTYNALFGDFARSLLPSRAALINSRLLNTSRLINVQTLILLSVAAQQFDPHGWAEHLFTHACMLARTMGLQHVHHLPDSTGANETLERAKVLRALYTRDKSLCITRGCIPWLSRDDCDVASQLGPVMERPAPSSDRLKLAIVQDDVYRLANADPRRGPCSNSTINSAVRRIKQHLDQYMHAFGIFDSGITDSPRRALIPLEFLATRILALQHRSKASDVEQLRLDARASCQLLLIAHGDQDRQLIDAFNSTNCPRTTPSPPTEDLLASSVGPVLFASILDAFSVPAFFILLGDLLQPTGNDGVLGSVPDFDLLGRVSACYK
ncbi:MAG: hypothetical protein L6R40_008582 [Gallowayella cf. fulva]|nr:MAG: hypothetical protein L6R40_008582 [Xanthomendoza cf. fulva]